MNFLKAKLAADAGDKYGKTLQPGTGRSADKKYVQVCLQHNYEVT